MRAVVPALLVLGLGLHGVVAAQELDAVEPEAPSGYEMGEPAAHAQLRAAPAGDGALDRGIASWYGPRFHGRRTASGERFDMRALTAAHPTLPFGTVVRVENPESGRSVDVRINDRGPHIKARIIDLSRAAARALGLLDVGAGLKEVVLKIVRPAPN